MSFTAKTIVTFHCDGCGAEQHREEGEGYETSFTEQLPEGWKRFAACFSFVFSAAIHYILCETCADTVACSLAHLGGGKGIA